MLVPCLKVTHQNCKTNIMSLIVTELPMKTFLLIKFMKNLIENIHASTQIVPLIHFTVYTPLGLFIGTR